MAKFRKIKKADKLAILQKIDWEGGLDEYIRHGGIFDDVKGTVLEEPIQKLSVAMREAEDAVDKELGVL